MVIEIEPLRVATVLAGFAWAALWVGLTALVAGYLIAAFRHGPLHGGDVVYKTVRTGLTDMLRTSPRRIVALTRLAAIEAVRRRIFLALAIFLALLMFAPWFLDTSVVDPSAQYLGFVLDWSWFLSLLVALFLGAFSLPQDIKQRTIHTVVTKPVRPVEIVLGRILGFSLVGSLMLAIMAAIGYVFVLRSLSHSHQVEADSFISAPEEAGGGKTGKTSTALGHHHQVNVWPDGTATTSVDRGHWHDVTPQVHGGKTAYALGAPRGALLARVPVYGSLRFRDRKGEEAERGISVGDEWKYRSYVVGNSQASGVWTFHGVTADAFPPDEFPDGLPLEMSIDVFRAYKGDPTSIDFGVAGSIQLKNPKSGLASQRLPFRAKDKVDRRSIPWQLAEQHSGRPLDLLRDLAHDGSVEIWIQCLDHEQYFGVAAADLYLHARDGSFAWNVVKGFAGIWLQMMLVCAFGVMFSTFLSGAVAMLATLGAIVMGLFTGFIFGVARGEIEGGGPVESLVRIVRQDNVVTPLEPGFTTTVVKNVDYFILQLMEAAARLVPNFRQFDNGPYLTQGFDVPAHLVYGQLIATACYVAAVSLIGYFFLKTREVAR